MQADRGISEVDSMLAPGLMADRCRYRADDSAILAEAFRDKEFFYRGLPLTPDEAFSNDAFLPLIAGAAYNGIRSISPEHNYIRIGQSDENRFISAMVDARHPNPHCAMIFLLNCISVTMDMIGNENRLDFADVIGNMSPGWGSEYRPETDNA